MPSGGAISERRPRWSYAPPLHYDPVDGKLLKLRFAGVHQGIVKKGDFYVSCADFVDQDGRKIDVDYLVIPVGDEMRATQGIVHSVDGKKRK